MNSINRTLCLCVGTVLMASTALGQDPVMRVTGQCPGRISVEVGGATPNGIIGVLIALQSGTTRIPAGPCQGTMLGLGMRGLRLAAVQRADGQGHTQFGGEVSQQACGKYLQAIDGHTCSTSNVVRID